MSLRPALKWILGILVGLLLLIAGTALTGIILSCEEVATIEQEMLQDASNNPVVIDDSTILALPKPVQRYAHFALGQKRIFPAKAIRWEEKGTFNLPKLGRFDMESWQVSRLDSPHYLWRGFMRKMGGLLTLESRDYFALTTHDMRAKIWGLKTIMRSDYKTKEDLKSLHTYLMLRYYGTALNFPWVLFSDPGIHWEAHNANQAWMIANMDGKLGRYLVTFEKDGRISTMESPDFHLHGNGESLKERSEKSDYVSWQGIMIPSRIKYIWTDRQGDQTTYTLTIKNQTIIKE